MKESFISWNEYTFLFREKAKVYGIQSEDVERQLLYAKPLIESKLPVIYDLQHLAYLTEFKLTYIKRAITKPENFYRYFGISKKNGHTRNISEPLPGLKQIQYWIVQNILTIQEPNRLNNAYSLGKSIKTNAKYHTKQTVVLTIDIEDYFQNISRADISTFFKDLGYTKAVANGLAGLCTLNNGLPQGAPSSPTLSNLITKELDVEVFDYCRNINSRYSRYADDITISGDLNIDLVISDIRGILQKYGFQINNKKIRAKRQHQRQMVTGIVVNKKLSVKRYDLRKIRQELYYIKTKGLNEHLSWLNQEKRNYLNHLLGQINFYLFIRPDNSEVLEYKKYLYSLIQDKDNEIDM